MAFFFFLSERGGNIMPSSNTSSMQSFNYIVLFSRQNIDQLKIFFKSAKMLQNFIVPMMPCLNKIFSVFREILFTSLCPLLYHIFWILTLIKNV